MAIVEKCIIKSLKLIKILQQNYCFFFVFVFVVVFFRILALTSAKLIYLETILEEVHNFQADKKSCINTQQGKTAKD